MALAWPRGNAQAVLSGRLLLERRPEGILVTKLVSETWAVCPGWRMLWPPCSHGAYEMLGGRLQDPPAWGGGGWEQLAAAQGGHFVFRIRHRIGHGQKKWGWGSPSPPRSALSWGALHRHPRTLGTGMPAACRLIPEQLPAEPPSPSPGEPFLPRWSCLIPAPAPDKQRCLRREHGDLSPVPESPPPAELPRVGFDGSSPGVISNSPGACH